MCALRVYRDQTNLTANPNLWSTIQAALEKSEYLLLLASPAAAASKWVQKETQFFCDQRGADNIILVLTDGKLSWDDKEEDFDWKLTNAIPGTLSEKFDSQPLYVDFRELKKERLSLRDLDFIDHIATIAAVLHGKEKDEIASEDVRQHKRTQTLVRCVIFTLAALLILSIYLGLQFRHERNVALRNLSVSLAAQSQANRARHPQRAVLLAAEAINAWTDKAIGRPHPRAETSLRNALGNFGGVGLCGHGDAVTSVAFSPENQWLVTGSKDGTARLWDLTSGDSANKPLVLNEHDGAVWSVAISLDNRWLVTGNSDGIARLWDLASGKPSKEPHLLKGHEGTVSNVAFSPNGRWLVTGGWRVMPRLWDLTSGVPANKPTVLQWPFRRPTRTLLGPWRSARIIGGWQPEVRMA